MTLAVDWAIKPKYKQNKQKQIWTFHPNCVRLSLMAFLSFLECSERIPPPPNLHEMLLGKYCCRNIIQLCGLIIWAASWQNQQNDCAPSEDSDQSGHPPYLIRVFAVHIKKAWVLSYPLSATAKTLIRLGGSWAIAARTVILLFFVCVFCLFFSWGGSVLIDLPKWNTIGRSAHGTRVNVLTVQANVRFSISQVPSPWRH